MITLIVSEAVVYAIVRAALIIVGSLLFGILLGMTVYVSWFRDRKSSDFGKHRKS